MNTAPQSGSGTRARGSVYAPWGQFGDMLALKGPPLGDFPGFRSGISVQKEVVTQTEVSFGILTIDGPVNNSKTAPQ